VKSCRRHFLDHWPVASCVTEHIGSLAGGFIVTTRKYKIQEKNTSSLVANMFLLSLEVQRSNSTCFPFFYFHV
jgi:hypothetical protein